MNIEELIKDLDPVTIIEFKNHLTENLSKLCSMKNSNSKIISKFKTEESLKIYLDSFYIKELEKEGWIVLTHKEDVYEDIDIYKLYKMYLDMPYDMQRRLFEEET